MKKSIVTRRTFLSATTATALSGLLRPVLPAESPPLAAVPASAQPSAEPRYLGKSLHQLVQELHSFDSLGRGSKAARRTEENLVEALGCIGLPALPCLEITLREGGPAARKVAVRAMGGMRSPVAVPSSCRMR